MINNMVQVKLMGKINWK